MESSIHHYEKVKADYPVLGRKVGALTADTFAPEPTKMSLPLVEIEGHTSPPAWWSPSPGNFNAPQADLAVLRQCQAEGRVDLLDDAWMGALFQRSHQMCCFASWVRCPNGAYFIPLHHFVGSAVLMWPAELKKLPGDTSGPTVVSFMFGVRRPIVVPVLSIHNIKAFPIAWRSWAWQQTHIKGCHSELKPGVRAFQDGAEEAFERVAARNAWWDLDQGFIRRLCTRLGLRLRSPSGDLLDTIVDSVMRVLGVEEEEEEEEALQIARIRLARMRRASSYSKQLANVDEAMKVLDRNDTDSFKSAQAAAAKRVDVMCVYKEAFKQRRQAARARVASGPSRSNAGGKKAKNNSKPMVMPPISAIAHADVRKFAPPTARIWKANSTGEWIGHVPPNPTCSRSWRRHGECEALRLVLAHCWRQHCDLEGIAYESCPMQGILDSRPIEAAAAASSTTG